MERPNYRKASIYFDDETVLEVTQRGGGGSGVGGETGLEAVNLKTGESTNAALAAKDETIAEQAGTIESQAGTIEEQAATIETQAATIIEKDETITEQATTIQEQTTEIASLKSQLARAMTIKRGRVNITNNSGANVKFMGVTLTSDSSGSYAALTLQDVAPTNSFNIAQCVTSGTRLCTTFAVEGDFTAANAITGSESEFISGKVYHNGWTTVTLTNYFDDGYLVLSHVS